MTEQHSDRAGHEEKHGAGEEEAIEGPAFIEKRRSLGVEGSEEAGRAAYGVIASEDAGIARLPGQETDQESDGDGKPRQVDCGDSVLLDNPRETRRDFDDRSSETAKGDEAEDESGGRKDRKKVVEEKDGLIKVGPVHFRRDCPDGKDEDPGELDGKGGDEDV